MLQFQNKNEQYILYTTAFGARRALLGFISLRVGLKKRRSLRFASLRICFARIRFRPFGYAALFRSGQTDEFGEISSATYLSPGLLS